MQGMQSEIIHFYATNPQHFWELRDATVSYTESNRICWDTITVFLVIEEMKIKKWLFFGDVSLITKACSGLFWDMVEGVDVYAVMQWTQKTVIDMTGIEVSPRRKRAQVLALLATKNALHIYLWHDKKDDFSDIMDE